MSWLAIVFGSHKLVIEGTVSESLNLCVSDDGEGVVRAAGCCPSKCCLVTDPCGGFGTKHEEIV